MNLIATQRNILFFTLLVSLIIKLSAVMILNVEPTSDAAAYMKMAITMMNTGHMDDGMGNVAYYSAGYPLFLIPFFAIFGANAEVAQFVNVMLGVTSIFLVYICSKYILPDWRWAILPALIWATYPPAILYTEYVAKENLMIMLLLLQTLLLLHYPYSQHKIALSLLLGIIFGMGLLVGAAIILTGALIVIVVIGFNIKRPALLSLCWRQILVCCFGCAIILTPWLSYTNSKLGQPVLNTNGGFNLYLGNNANSTPYYIGIEDTPIASEWQSLRREKGEIGSMSYLKEQAIKYMWENPTETLWLSARKIIYFWAPPLNEGKYGNQTKVESIMRVIWLFYYIFIITAALIPLVFYKMLNKAHLILYSTALLYCVIHAAAYVMFRYQLTIMPIMCILAGYGLSLVHRWWSNKNNSIHLRTE